MRKLVKIDAGQRTMSTICSQVGVDLSWRTKMFNRLSETPNLLLEQTSGETHEERESVLVILRHIMKPANGPEKITVTGIRLLLLLLIKVRGSVIYQRIVANSNAKLGWISDMIFLLDLCTPIQI